MNMIVAEHNKIKVSNEHGSIEIKRINNWLGEIEKFYVEEKYRGNGIGTSLLQDAELKAKEWDIKKLSMLCRVDNRTALNLYLKNGGLSRQGMVHRLMALPFFHNRSISSR